MEITITPDTYTPIVDCNGNYVDRIPTIRHGIFCPCGSRKDKAYENNSKFASHIKTKTHQKWLIAMNQDKANYYVDLLKTKELVEQQKNIIAQLENQLQRKNLTIDYLTEQLQATKQVCSINLLDI